MSCPVGWFSVGFFELAHYLCLWWVYKIKFQKFITPWIISLTKNSKEGMVWDTILLYGKQLLLLVAQNSGIRTLGQNNRKKKSSPNQRAKWKSRTVKSIHQLSIFLWRYSCEVSCQFLPAAFKWGKPSYSI